MKKTILLLSLIITTSISFAQTLGIGIKGGINLSTVSFNVPSPYILQSKLGTLTGYQIGGLLNIGFKHIEIQPGISFSTKGYTTTNQLYSSYGEVVGTSTSTITLNYMEVPVNLLYHTRVSNSASIHIGGGPYLGYGLSGKIVNETYSANIVFTNNPSLTTPSFRNPDYGMNILTGIKLKNKIIIDAGYGFGMANLGYNSTTIHNRVASFSVGYMLK